MLLVYLDHAARANRRGNLLRSRPVRGVKSIKTINCYLVNLNMEWITRLGEWNPQDDGSGRFTPEKRACLLQSRNGSHGRRWKAGWAFPVNLTARVASLALRFSLTTVVGRSGFDTRAEVVSTVDECEMRKRLRKISQLALFFGIVFFSQKADIVAQRK